MGRSLEEEDSPQRREGAKETAKKKITAEAQR